MSILRGCELLAWALGLALLTGMLRDALRTGRSYRESLLLSSREGEIDEELQDVERSLEDIESRLDRTRPEHP